MTIDKNHVKLILKNQEQLLLGQGQQLDILMRSIDTPGARLLRMRTDEQIIETRVALEKMR